MKNAPHSMCFDGALARNSKLCPFAKAHSQSAVICAMGCPQSPDEEEEGRLESAAVFSWPRVAVDTHVTNSHWQPT